MCVYKKGRLKDDFGNNSFDSSYMVICEIRRRDFPAELGIAENKSNHSRNSDVAGNIGDPVIPGIGNSSVAGDPDLRNDRPY